MITGQEAKAQLSRLTGLDFFPKEAAAQKEIALAIQAAASADIAHRVISEWLASCRETPKPADLRRLVWDENQRLATVRRECPDCSGSGFRSVPFLVTYRGSSFIIAKREPLRNMTQREEGELRAKCAENQDILSYAVPCGCPQSGTPKCARCQDFGHYGGRIGGEYGGVWKLCDCERAIGMEAVVEHANQVREKLLARFSGVGRGRNRPADPLTPAVEVYCGDF